jgi:hypothetical protein
VSFVEVLPEIQSLARADKLRLIPFPAQEMAEAEGLRRSWPARSTLWGPPTTHFRALHAPRGPARGGRTGQVSAGRQSPFSALGDTLHEAA